jgi:hypothetical protein
MYDVVDDHVAASFGGLNRDASEGAGGCLCNVVHVQRRA